MEYSRFFSESASAKSPTKSTCKEKLSLENVEKYIHKLKTKKHVMEELI